MRGFLVSLRSSLVSSIILRHRISIHIYIYIYIYIQVNDLVGLAVQLVPLAQWKLERNGIYRSFLWWQKFEIHKTVPRLGHNSFLPNPFRFINHPTIQWLPSADTGRLKMDSKKKNLNILCTNVNFNVLRIARTSLWSNGQSSWLQIQRPGFDARRYRIFWEVVGLEHGPLSLVSTIEELLGRKSSGSCLDNQEYSHRDASYWARDNLYLQKLALTSSKSLFFPRPH
jgi:hypothetical protein